MRRIDGLLVLGAIAVYASGCAQFRSDGAAVDASADSAVDAGQAVDAADASPPVDGSSAGDGGTADAADDAWTSDAATVDAGPDGGIDPLLGVPPAGPTCDPTQGDSTCTSLGETCRISSATAGTCDTFTAGHEGGFPCTTSADCDDTLQCYNGTCHVLCPLGMTCAGGCACFPVGNDAVGLCCPGQ